MAGLTLADVASSTGYAQTTLSSVENHHDQPSKRLFAKWIHAEMVFALTASAFDHSHRKWERAISAASHANGFFVFRVNRVGQSDKQEFYGKSFCCGPDGEMLDEPSGASEGVVMAEAALSEVAAVRSEWVFLKDRRPGAYTEIAEARK